MAMFTISGGTLPTREEFDQAWDKQDDDGELRGGFFHFGNDKCVGTCAMNSSELWAELEKASKEYTEKAQDWINAVLFCFDIEII